MTLLFSYISDSLFLLVFHDFQKTVIHGFKGFMNEIGGN